MAYSNANARSSAASTNSSSSREMSSEEQTALIDERIAEHSTRVQMVQAILVQAYLYPGDLNTSARGVEYCRLNCQVVWEESEQARQSEYIETTVFGEEARALQQVKPYLVNDRGKAKPVLISYIPSKLTGRVGTSKAGEPTAYLRADKIFIFLDLTSTLVVGARQEGQQQEEAQETTAAASPATSASSSYDDMPF